MNKIISLIINTIKYFEAKIILNSLKNNKFISYSLRLYLIIVIINIIIIAPLFFISNAIFTIFTLFAISILELIIFLILYKIKINSVERLDKFIINNSIYKIDFFNYLKNDIFFNLKFSILFSLLLFFYQLIIYAIISFFPNGLSKFQLFKIPVIYLIFFIMFFSIFLLLYYLKFKNKKSVFVQVTDNNKFLKSFLPVILLFFIFILTFVITLSIIKNLLLTILISATIALIGYFIFIKKNLNNKISLLYFIKNIIYKLTHFKFSFKINSIYKFIKSFELFYPILFALIFFITLTIWAGFISNLNFKIRIFQSFLFGMLFTYKLIIKLNNKSSKQDILKPFTLTSFIYVVMLIITFISLIKIKFETKGENILIFSFKEFLFPYINYLNSYCENIHKFLNSINIIFAFFIPFIFLALFYVNKKINIFFHYISNKIDQNLKKKLTKKNPTIIFGDSISLYPFLFSLIITILITLFLYIGIIPISKFFYYIFDTFKISEIFRINLLEKNIMNFFKVFYYIFFISVVLKFIIFFFSSVLSHFILFSDEIIYYENKIYKNSILRIPLSRINYILIKQNIIEKIFDYGTLFIETIDKSGVIKIKGIPSIKEKNILIMDKIKGDL